MSVQFKLMRIHNSVALNLINLINKAHKTVSHEDSKRSVVSEIIKVFWHNHHATVNVNDVHILMLDVNINPKMCVYNCMHFAAAT